MPLKQLVFTKPDTMSVYKMIDETADTVKLVLEGFDRKDLCYTSENEKYVIKIEISERVKT